MKINATKFIKLHRKVSFLTLLTILCFTLVVSGCGQTGPLYLPEESVSFRIN